MADSTSCVVCVCGVCRVRQYIGYIAWCRVDFFGVITLIKLQSNEVYGVIDGVIRNELDPVVMQGTWGMTCLNKNH